MYVQDVALGAEPKVVYAPEEQKNITDDARRTLAVIADLVKRIDLTQAPLEVRNDLKTQSTAGELANAGNIAAYIAEYDKGGMPWYDARDKRYKRFVSAYRVFKKNVEAAEKQYGTLARERLVTDVLPGGKEITKIIEKLPKWVLPAVLVTAVVAGGAMMMKARKAKPAHARA
jgi:hypothetical protein